MCSWTIERDQSQYLWYKRFQRSKNIFVIHFGTDIITSIDAQVSEIMTIYPTKCSISSTHRRAPAASTTTSSSLSVSRVINAPTTFFPCNNRRVEGSFCIRLETATHAHLRSAGSVLSILHKSLDGYRFQIFRNDLLYNGQNLQFFWGSWRCRCQTMGEMRVWHSHRIMTTHWTLFLGFAHDWLESLLKLIG